MEILNIDQYIQKTIIRQQPIWYPTFYIHMW